MKGIVFIVGLVVMPCHFRIADPRLLHGAAFVFLGVGMEWRCQLAMVLAVVLVAGVGIKWHCR